jgi:hypothetical protein
MAVFLTMDDVMARASIAPTREGCTPKSLAGELREIQAAAAHMNAIGVT